MRKSARLVVLLVLLHVVELLAQPRGSDTVVGISESGNLRVTIERTGENQFEVFLLKKAPAGKEKIWGSFWGIIDAKFSPDERYVAIRDGMRFDVLSPVLVFRIQPVGTALVYETPGSFSAEETHFTYEIGAFEHDRLSIRVFSLQRDSASRATPKFQFEYAVENLDKRQPIDSFFYTGVERRRLLQKGR